MHGHFLIFGGVPRLAPPKSMSMSDTDLASGIQHRFPKGSDVIG